MNSKDFMIGVLTVTAVILLTTVVLLSVLSPQPVQAANQLVRGGGYTLYTLQVSETRENVCVLNESLGLLNIYGYDINRQRMIDIQQIPLTPQQPGVGETPTIPAR